MKIGTDRLGKRLVGLAFLAAVAFVGWAGYQTGYRAGVADQGPDYRYLIVTHRTPGHPNGSSSSYRLFDLRKPADAAKLRKEIDRLKSIGADYHVAGAVIERTIIAEPVAGQVNSHR